MKLTVTIALDNAAFWYEDGRLNVDQVKDCFRAVEWRVGTVREGKFTDFNGNVLGTFTMIGQKPKEFR